MDSHEKNAAPQHLEHDGDESFVDEKGVVAASAAPTAEQMKRERSLVWKLDFRILPFAACLYLSAFLDRGNIGNAKLQGLFKDLLHSNDTKYSVVLLSFFVTYILLSIPGTLIARRFSPARTIGCGCVIWATAATAMSGATSFGGLVTARLFIGVGEAAFGQAMALYLSIWYRKNELATRIAFFIGAGVAAGAFGGLIAFGVAHIENPTIARWRVLFLIEGVPSLLLGICVFLFLPSRPMTSNFLNAEEKELMMARFDRDAVGRDTETGIDWRAVRAALVNPRNIIMAVAYSCMNCTLGSVSGFLPTIIKQLGFSDAKAQLMTVPAYVVALVVMLIMTNLSDRLQSRGIFVAIVFSLSTIGWTILLTVPHTKAEYTTQVRYFADILVVIGGYCAIPLIMSWVSGNNPNESGRAAALGLLNSVGQCLSIAATFLFPSTEGPRFIRGITVNLALTCLAATIAISMTLYYRFENRRRDKAEGGPPAPGTVIDCSQLYDKTPGFRYTV